MNHVELFAGCGGLSLGLEQAGFKLLLANELSPMAAETFVYNFFNEDLESVANQGEMPTSALWLTSKYDKLSDRLKENPFDYPHIDEGFSDIPSKKEELCGKLIVGNIVTLNELLSRNKELKESLMSAFGTNGGLDIVTGGPPCQGFSMAGKRVRNDDKNTLPWEFIKFVKMTQPKIALLENVTGILRPFRDINGDFYYAWYEVAKGFASINYIPICLHLNARKAGVAQNRPRFIMISIRQDVIIEILKNPNFSDNELFNQPMKFFKKVSEEGVGLKYGNLDFIDVDNPDDMGKLKNTFLFNLVDKPDISVKEALHDLHFYSTNEPSLFVKSLNKKFTFLKDHAKILNHEPRKNSAIVKRRFRVYQVLNDINDGTLKSDVFKVLRGKKETLNQETWNRIKNYKFLHEDGELSVFNTKEGFENYLKAHPTKKQRQRALSANAPAPSALTIPDDACHYDEEELRVLTVREMARIQSFPDNFVFRSKVTTGAHMRKYETPQYTQVGNAVPPLLGYELGISLRKLLSYCNS